MTQLDRIEQKLDRLLRLFGSTESPKDIDVKSAVYASGGTEGLKEFMRAESERKSKEGKK